MADIPHPHDKSSPVVKINKKCNTVKLNEEKKQTVKKENAVMGKGREQQYTYRVKNSMTTDGPTAKT